MRRITPYTGPSPDYPARAAKLPDAGRRRFLRQIAVGAGAAALGLEALADHGEGDCDECSGALAARDFLEAAYL